MDEETKAAIETLTKAFDAVRLELFVRQEAVKTVLKAYLHSSARDDAERKERLDRLAEACEGYSIFLDMHPEMVELTARVQAQIDEIIAFAREWPPEEA
jgi:ATP-dependent helicase YprA (DUF1998 family)